MSRSRTAVAVVAGVVLLLTMGTAWVVMGDDSRPEAGRETPAAAQESPASEAPGIAWLEPDDAQALEDPTPGQRRASRAARGDLVKFVRATAPGGPSQWEALTSSAVGAARGEIEAMRRSYADEGLSLVGTPRVVSTSVRSVDAAASPRTVVLDVCIDASDVDVLDQNGRSVGDRVYRSPSPVLNVYELRESDTGWRVSRHAIPAESTCEKEPKKP